MLPFSAVSDGDEQVHFLWLIIKTRYYNTITLATVIATCINSAEEAISFRKINNWAEYLG